MFHGSGGGGFVRFESAPQLFEHAGARAQVLLLLDHFHDAQHEFEILVLGARATAAAAAAATILVLFPFEFLRPLGEFVRPFLRLLGCLIGMVGREFGADFLQADVDLGFAHVIEDLP